MTLLNPLPSAVDRFLSSAKSYSGIRNKAFSVIHLFDLSVIHRKYILSLRKVPGPMRASQQVMRLALSPGTPGTPAGEGVEWGRWSLPIDLDQHLHLLFLTLFLLFFFLLPFWKKPETVLEFPLHVQPPPHPQASPVWRRS